MNNIFSWFRKENPKNRKLIIGIALIIILILIKTLGYALSLKIEKNKDTYISKITQYYDSAFNVAFTNEKIEFLNEISSDVDFISRQISKSRNTDQRLSSRELPQKEIKFEEFKDITDTYNDIVNLYDAYNTKLSAIDDKIVLEGLDPKSPYIQSSYDTSKSILKPLASNLDSFDEKMYLILESRKIDTNILKSFNISNINSLPYDLKLSELKELYKSLPSLDTVVNNHGKHSDPNVPIGSKSTNNIDNESYEGNDLYHRELYEKAKAELNEIYNTKLMQDYKSNNLNINNIYHYYEELSNFMSTSSSWADTLWQERDCTIKEDITKEKDERFCISKIVTSIEPSLLIVDHFNDGYKAISESEVLDKLNSTMKTIDSNINKIKEINFIN